MNWIGVSYFGNLTKPIIDTIDILGTSYMRKGTSTPN